MDARTFILFFRLFFRVLVIATTASATAILIAVFHINPNIDIFVLFVVNSMMAYIGLYVLRLPVRLEKEHEARRLKEMAQYILGLMIVMEEK